MSADDLELRDVGRLALRPGDSLVISYPGPVRPDFMGHIEGVVRERLGLDDSVRVLILDHGATVQVVEAPPGEITR